MEDNFTFQGHIKSHSVKNLVSLDRGVSLSLLAVGQEEERMTLAKWLLSLPVDNICNIKVTIENKEE